MTQPLEQVNEADALRARLISIVPRLSTSSLRTHGLQLPLTKILLGSVLLPIMDWRRYASSLALPTLLLVAVWALDALLVKERSTLVGWLMTFPYWIAFGVFAVACHRTVLLGGTHSPLPILLSGREVRFVGWLVGIYAVYLVAGVVLMTIAINLPLPVDPPQTQASARVWQFLCFLPSVYVLARLSMVFPATAVDARSSIERTWKLTRRNGWKLAVVVGLYPWLLDAFLDTIAREDGATLERVAVSLLSYIVLAVQVVALSLAYRELDSGDACVE